MEISDAIFVALRVSVCCSVFAFFLFCSFKSRLRLGYGKTAAFAAIYIGVTVLITLLFLLPASPLKAFNILGICLWIGSAIIIVRILIKGSIFEVLFSVLVTLNLYVNIVAIAKVSGGLLGLDPMDEKTEMLLILAVLAAYTPLLWALMNWLYRQVISYDLTLSFWKFIWIIPALTYLIFYVKIVNDYWINSVSAGAGDVAFIILWSFTTYAFFFVTLQMIIQAYRGIVASQQADLIASQLSMQKGQYEKLLENIEETARLKHDWRHHLLCLEGFAESGNESGLREYLKQMVPEYINTRETSLCRNHMVDMILRHYAVIAENEHIRFTVMANVPAALAVSDMDLCVIFGNIVENAVEACSCPEMEDRHVEIRAEVRGNQLILLIRNAYCGEVIETDGRYASTKHEGMGIGLASVKNIVDKYHGIMRVEHDGHVFTVRILLPGAE